MFAQLLPALELYPEYVKNHWRAILEVNKHEHANKEFALFLQRAKEASEARLDLLSCLIAPVQRIPRYRLLLGDILKRTPDDGSDRAHIEAVYRAVSDLAERVNGDMRRQENFQRQLQLQRAFVGNIANIASYDRTLVRDGQLLKRVRYGSSKPRWFFLFNDCLIYAKTVQVPSVGVIETYEGHLFSLCRFLSHVSARNAPHEGDTGFEIVSLQKSFTVFAETPEEKQAWLAAIKAVGGTASEGSHAPVWMADTETTKCLLCGQKFTLTLRRHHCRNCGSIVCGQCSTQRARLAHLDISSDPVRVCDKCAATLGLPSKTSRTQSFRRLLNRFIPRTPPPPSSAVPASTPQQGTAESTPTRARADAQSASAQRPQSSGYVSSSSSGTSSPAPALLSTKSPTQEMPALDEPQQQPPRTRPHSLQLVHPPAFALQLRQRSASSPASLASVEKPLHTAGRDLIELDETPSVTVAATTTTSAPPCSEASKPTAEQQQEKDVLLVFGIGPMPSGSAPVPPAEASARKPSEDLLSFDEPAAKIQTPSPGPVPVSPAPTKRSIAVIPDASTSPLATSAPQRAVNPLGVITTPSDQNKSPASPTEVRTPTTPPSAMGRPPVGMGLFLLSPGFVSATSPESLDPWAPIAAAAHHTDLSTPEAGGGGDSSSEAENPFATPRQHEDSATAATTTASEEAANPFAMDEDEPSAATEAPAPATTGDENPFSSFIAPK